MLPKHLHILCLLWLFNSSVQVPPKRYNFTVNNVTCVSFKNTLKHFECEVTKLAMNHYEYTGLIMFSKNMHKNFYFRYFIDMAPLSKNNLIRFIDVKVSACDAIKTRYEIPMLQNIIIEIRRSSNIPYQCPFQSNFPYTFKNLSFSDKFFNKIMPYVDYVQRLDFYEWDTLIGSLITKGSILPIMKSKKN